MPWWFWAWAGVFVLYALFGALSGLDNDGYSRAGIMWGRGLFALVILGLALGFVGS